MKCCGSQTTSTAPEPAARAASLRSADAPRFFEALMLSAALKPVADALGYYGELVIERCAQEATFREARR